MMQDNMLGAVHSLLYLTLARARPFHDYVVQEVVLYDPPSARLETKCRRALRGKQLISLDW